MQPRLLRINNIDVQDLDVDFLAFSLHKMCGPRGIGVLYGKEEFVRRKQHSHESGLSKDTIEPVLLGGGTVADSTYNHYDLLRPPESYEPGIQNYPAQIGAGEAVKYLRGIGLERIHKHVIALNRFLTERLFDKYGDTGWFDILGPSNAEKRGRNSYFRDKAAELRRYCRGVGCQKQHNDSETELSAPTPISIIGLGMAGPGLSCHQSTE